MSKSNTQHLFIISKPLQLMVANLLRQQIAIDGKCIFLIINYNDWFDIITSDYSSKNVSIIVFKATAQAYRNLFKYQNAHLYIDSDVGFRKYLILVILKFFLRVDKISVYEEGIGTYRSDLYSGIKKTIFELFGIGTYFGGSIVTDEIFVFDPIKYALKTQSRITIRKIFLSIESYIKDNIILLLKEYNIYEFLNKVIEYEPYKCSLYLASWDVDENIIKQIKMANKPIIYKHHPHRKNKIDRRVFDIEISGKAPAELIIYAILHYFNEVDVYHHGSSVENYIKSNKVKFHKLSEIIKWNFK